MYVELKNQKLLVKHSNITLLFVYTRELPVSIIGPDQQVDYHRYLVLKDTPSVIIVSFTFSIALQSVHTTVRLSYVKK